MPGGAAAQPVLAVATLTSLCLQRGCRSLHLPLCLPTGSCPMSMACGLLRRPHFVLPHLLSIPLCLQGCHLSPRLPMRSLCCAGCLLQRSGLLPRSRQLPLQATVYAVEDALLPPAERCTVQPLLLDCQLLVAKPMNPLEHILLTLKGVCCGVTL